MNAPLVSMGVHEPGMVVQLGYLVPSLEPAVRQWVEGAGAGPFFRTGFDLAFQAYRGAPSGGRIEIAVGWRAGMCVELIEYCGAGPSVFGAAPADSARLHHLMIATADLDADLARHRAAGHEVVVDADVPGFGRAAFADTRETLGHYTEYGLWAPPVLAALQAMQAAHDNWDGRDPLRPYPEIG